MGALARDHESWPCGESRNARFEPSPCRSGFRLRLARRQVAVSALRAFAARQDTNTAAYAAHEYAPGLHEYRAIFCYNCRGIPFDAKKELRICYKGVSELTKEHRAQLLNYLRLTKCKMGLLVNFASYPKATVEQWAL